MTTDTTTPATDNPAVRDPQTGRLYPGAKLPGAGNPIARLQYQHRKRFLDAVTDDELDKARAQLVADMFDPSAKVRQAARAQYFDLTYGKATQTHEISRVDEGASRSAMEDKMGRILDALADDPAARAKVADILLNGGDQPIEVIATVVTTEALTEILPGGQSD